MKIEQPMEIRRADFSLEEEHRALRQAFAALLARECPTERVRASEPVGFDDGLWAEFVGMRSAAMGVPEENGGDGAGLLELVLVVMAVPILLAEAVLLVSLLARAPAQPPGDLRRMHRVVGGHVAHQ